MSERARTAQLQEFILKNVPSTEGHLTAISLFSGAGLSDLGYAEAGFRFLAHVETEPERIAVGEKNFLISEWINMLVVEAIPAIERAVHGVCRLDLLVATPPCQGMSTSNPARGKRSSAKAHLLEEKNKLILDIIPAVRALKPRIIVAENVRQVLTLEVQYEGRQATILDHLINGLNGYRIFSGAVNVADYGIPQRRWRAIVVAVDEKELWLNGLLESKKAPWPAQTHAEKACGNLLPWVTIGEWLRTMEYQPLDARSPAQAQGDDPLHNVPYYPDDRYLQISQIPPYSGKSAYENDVCPNCYYSAVPRPNAFCPQCGELMRNRPYVKRADGYGLIKGFDSSYRRMEPDRPSYTITTASSHVGSDFKIHPWENRVLSARECADLQTIPRYYDWSGALDRGKGKKPKPYLIRVLAGEALPPYFTFLHGTVLASLLRGEEAVMQRLAVLS